MEAPVSEVLRQYARERILPQVQVLRREQPGVLRNTDEEYLHRTRVALRRLNTALQSFADCFPPKLCRQSVKRLKQFSSVLGPARDLDVQSQFLHEFREQSEQSANGEGLQALQNRLKQERCGLQRELERAIFRLQEQDVLSNLEASLQSEVELAGSAAELVALKQLAQENICRRAEQFYHESDVISDPENVEGLHALRIHAKHLRYTLELFNPLYDGSLSSGIAQFRRYQELLGQIHDCDVWLDLLTRFDAKESDTCLEPLRAFLLTRRAEAYRELLIHHEDNVSTPIRLG